jgi:hypothetical protein
MKKNPGIFIVFLIITISSCKKVSDPASNGQSKISFLPKDAVPVQIDFRNGKKLHLYQKDSSYFLEGDILLTKAQIELLKNINSNDAAQRAYTTDLVKAWQVGDVPYIINAGFSTADRTTILNAINDWNNVSSFHMRPGQGTVNYIEFMPSTNQNNSNIGMTGGRQVINLATQSGVAQHSAEHEIGHAIGFFHEQSRADRDNFIQINWNNIYSNQWFNFQTYSQQGIPGADLGTFDFNSIMLYASFTTDPNFVINSNLPIMQALNGATWPENFFLSTGDIETATFLYGPPFARIRMVATSSYYNPYGQDFDEYGDVIVDFFSDPGCTIPAGLPVTKTLTRRETVYLKNNGNAYTSYYEYTVTIPAGTSSTVLSQYHNFDDSYLGVSNNYEYHDILILNGYRR